MEEGLLGAVVYIGVAGSSIVAGPVFHFLNVKWTLVLMTIVNGAASTLFALGKSTIVLLMSRAVVGITQAFPIIYAPVFVDTFAPKARATLWMSMVLLASPVGIMLGYAAGVFATSLERSSPLDCVLDPWRVPLLLQGIVLLVFGAFGLLVPERHLVAGRTMSPGPLMVPSSANAFRSLVSNGVFVWTTVNLSILYFVVTGIQFWITVYLTEVVHADPVQTGLAFVAISATGPTGGVVFGGWMTDLMGNGSHCVPDSVGSNCCRTVDRRIQWTPSDADVTESQRRPERPGDRCLYRGHVRQLAYGRHGSRLHPSICWR